MATNLLLSRPGRLSLTITLIRSLSSCITPVSYPVKPKPQPPPQGSQSPPQDSQPPHQDSDSHTPPPNRPLRGESGLPFTREEYRFVKDAPLISPVSYAAKVANLPEDRVKEEGDGGEVDEEVRREGRRIEMDERVGRMLGLRMEEERLPFPTVVRKEKGAQKVVLELGEAIRQVKANAKCNFVETIEAHVNLGVDARRGDQMVRGALTLPHGTGKTVKVAVFAEGPAADEAREAGADVVGGEELIEEIRTGGAKLNFDKCIATPMFMPRVGKIGKILGPRGLMPNPKLGSVTSDVRGAVTAAKSGRLDFKIDKTSIVHVGLGKVNFSEDALRENIGAFVNALLVAKPVGLKKTSKYAGYVKNFTLSSTMGPGFPISIQSLSVAADNYVKLHGK